MPIVLPKCPDNYQLMKEKCRCKKKVSKKKEKSKKKTKKKPKKKTIKQIKEECKKKGKIYDSNIKKCRDRKKREKKDGKKSERNLLKSIITITKERSYSPTINKEFTRKDITHHKDLFGDCKDYEIKINGECLNWKDKRVEKYFHYK